MRSKIKQCLSVICGKNEKQNKTVPLCNQWQMKKLMFKKIFYITLLLTTAAQLVAQKTITKDVLVVGAGTGGTAAAIQAARLGVNTIVVEPTTWLGGMISAAGVSATDGNHKLPSGLWKEFRDNLYKVYGGSKAIETGWVSNTLFEPHVADSIFKEMATKEKNLSIIYQYNFEKAIVKNNKVIGVIFSNTKNEKLTVFAKIIIDATEFGDVIASANIPYSVGLEANDITKENVGVSKSNDIIQDLTYVAILKDFGEAENKKIAMPANYDANEFDGACTNFYNNKNSKAPNVDAKKMLDYGKLPNNKYMLNWPNKGNDTYLNLIAMSPAKRLLEIEKAKQTTLRFVYFIQNELGFKNLGLAEDEFPTADKLALMPYHRESRRVKGLVRFDLNNLAKPFDYDLYKTGIAVGDYPIDHHHKKNEDAPQQLEFYPVPSYNIPMGVLIPKNMDGILVAEKNISVSNVVNGTTRLQPVVMLTGQAVGILAALSVKANKQPRAIDVRKVQNELLKCNTYIMPYIDVQPTNPYFIAIQKIGATGILKGTGIPYKWANQTWFYPDSTIDSKTFLQDVNEFKKISYKKINTIITINDLYNIIQNLSPKKINGDSLNEIWKNLGLSELDRNRPAKRFEIAAMLNATINPFETKKINIYGKYLN